MLDDSSSKSDNIAGHDDRDGSGLAGEINKDPRLSQHMQRTLKHYDMDHIGTGLSLIREQSSLSHRSLPESPTKKIRDLKSSIDEEDSEERISDRSLDEKLRLLDNKNDAEI